MLDTIYQTISGMSSYLTTATASTTYQTLAGMSSYLTTATASSTYQTIAGMSSYLTTATASTTYSTLANQVKANTANAFTSTNTFNTNLPTSTLTPSTSTQLTNKAYVDSVVSGGLTGYATLAGTQTFTGVNTFRDALINTGLPKGNYIQLDPYFIKVDDSNVVTNNKNIYIEPEGLTLTNSIITQTGSIANTMTNSMVNLQVSTMSFKYEIFTTSTKDYSSLKMPSYIFENRTSGATCNLTLSTDDYLDDGQYLFIKRINSDDTSPYFYNSSMNIIAGSGTTISTFVNQSVSSVTLPLSSPQQRTISFIYNKPNLRWIQLTLIE
jgi:hypothetical protein